MLFKNVAVYAKLELNAFEDRRVIYAENERISSKSATQFFRSSFFNAWRETTIIQTI